MAPAVHPTAKGAIAPGARSPDETTAAMRLLVTGGSGFLGRFVLAKAARRGHSCVALARSEAAARTVAGYGATPLRADLDDTAGFAKALASEGIFASNGNFYAANVVERLGSFCSRAT